MNFLEVGETIVVDDGKEYVCYASIPYQEKMYAFLVSRTDKKKRLIVEQKNINGELGLEIIDNEELKQKLMNLFLEKVANIKNF